MNKRKLITSLVVAGLLSLGVGWSVTPASAESRTLLVTLADGQTVTVTVDVPPGTPVSAIPLPAFGAPVVGVADISAPAPAPEPEVEEEPAGEEGAGEQQEEEESATGEGTETTPPAERAPDRGGTPSRERPPVRLGSRTVESLATQREQQRQARRTQDGRPTLEDPTASFAIPGAVPIGVPNFFIEKFRIPPFLLPIYQAAGIEYGVPWQVLAAINEIETDYGRNLNVSSAGAMGWMQFIPSSWRAYGVDANGDGRKDPYNPVDAIFAAARYLKAAGADTDLRRAIYAYNHAWWYVDSVMMRARLIGGLPADLVGSLTGLTQGHFPVAAAAIYADDISEREAQRRVRVGENPAFPVESTSTRRSINIYTREGAPVIAVNDGEIRKVGRSDELGRYIVLQDVYGNYYVYAHLGKVAPSYPAPKPRAVSDEQIREELELPVADQAPAAPASAGTQGSAAGPPTPTASSPGDAQGGKERLFANPARRANLGNGGEEQLLGAGKPVAGYTSFESYFANVLGLSRDEVELRPLRPGADVIAGTVLGRVEKTDPQLAPHVMFAIKPTGAGAPLVDPKPILDGWKLLESTAIYRAAGQNPFFGPDARHPTIGQILLMSKEQLERRVIANPRVEIYDCGRRDVQTGQIDRRVLATIEYLAASGLRPSITSLKCGHSYYTKGGTVSHHSSGNAVDIAAVNGVPILGHQGPGSITAFTIERLLNLQGTLRPAQIISLMTFEGHPNTFSMGDHHDHIHVGFRPLYGTNSRLARQFNAVLKPGQWIKLIDRLNEIDNPVVPTEPSDAAIEVDRSSRSHEGE